MIGTCGLKLHTRIIWDNPELVERIWDRCILANGIKEELGRIEGRRAVEWEFSRLNERMRFLKYGAGQYFKSSSSLHLKTDMELTEYFNRQVTVMDVMLPQQATKFLFTHSISTSMTLFRTVEM